MRKMLPVPQAMWHVFSTRQGRVTTRRFQATSIDTGPHFRCPRHFTGDEEDDDPPRWLLLPQRRTAYQPKAQIAAECRFGGRPNSDKAALGTMMAPDDKKVKTLDQDFR
jgi:hypothetical protein